MTSILDFWPCCSFLQPTLYILRCVYSEDRCCQSVSVVVVQCVCPGCLFRRVGLNFALMMTVNYAVDYFGSVALTIILQLITFDVWP